VFARIKCGSPYLPLVGGGNVAHYIVYIQGESLARGPKLLSIKNYVIEIMT